MTKLGKAPLLKEQTITITTMRKSIARQLRCLNTLTRDQLESMNPVGWADTDAARGGGPLSKVVLVLPRWGDVYWLLDHSCKLTRIDGEGQTVWTPTGKVLGQIFIT